MALERYFLSTRPLVPSRTIARQVNKLFIHVQRGVRTTWYCNYPVYLATKYEAVQEQKRKACHSCAGRCTTSCSRNFNIEMFRRKNARCSKCGKKRADPPLYILSDYLYSLGNFSIFITYPARKRNLLSPTFDIRIYARNSLDGDKIWRTYLIQMIR